MEMSSCNTPTLLETQVLAPKKVLYQYVNAERVYSLDRKDQCVCNKEYKCIMKPYNQPYKDLQINFIRAKLL